jgi:hypothetical protein
LDRPDTRLLSCRVLSLLVLCVGLLLLHLSNLVVFLFLRLGLNRVRVRGLVRGLIGRHKRPGCGYGRNCNDSGYAHQFLSNLRL